MATGDTNDFILRLKAMLPQGWFPAQGSEDTSPILTSILSGPAWSLAQNYALTAYARLQGRIATATDVWLDIISLDYFNNLLTRRVNEPDANFSTRIRANLLAPKNTRAAIIQVLQVLTGRTPQVFEPGNTGDTGGWGGGEAKVWTGLAYGAAGGWGSLALPFQAFIIAYRPLGNGVAEVGGYYNPQIAITGQTMGAGYRETIIYASSGSPSAIAGNDTQITGEGYYAAGQTSLPDYQGGGPSVVGLGYGTAQTQTYNIWAGGGYGVGALEYVDAAIVADQVTDADIYAAIAQTQPAGTIMWTRIES